MPSRRIDSRSAICNKSFLPRDKLPCSAGELGVNVPAGDLHLSGAGEELSLEAVQAAIGKGQK